MTKHVTPLEARLAHELDEARHLLDEMGDQLATDVILVANHGVAIQTVDIVGQIMGHIANVVRAADPEAAVEDIGMHDLKMKLKAATCEQAA